MLDQIPRALRFARHIPPRKILRRLEIGALRHMAEGFHPPMRADAAPRLDAPLPLFAPRLGKAARRPDGWEFAFLGRAIGLGPDPDWGAAPNAPSDQLWRMNLHYMEYLEGLDDDAFVALVDAWIGANPPFQRSAWRDSWTTYAASLRAVVWMQQLAVRGARLPREFRRRCRASIVQHIVFIHAFLETDIGGNHLIKNIKALVWASCFFGGATTRRWRERALRLLRAELARQILPDGAHYERSASYHAQVFADLLEIRYALGADPFEGALDAALARMAQACADLAHPDGGPALFNDSGLSMAHAPGACLAAFALVLGPAPAPRPVFAFADAGYYGLRSGRTCFVADCGPLAPDDLPAHGHGDALSFELSLAGARFIVDQGVYEYAQGERRARARAAASHNTLCFEGADQAEFFGAFRMGRRARPRVRSWAPRADGFALEGEHDGFTHLPGAPCHVRRFDASPAAIAIEDRIEGRCPLAASAALLLHPEVEANPEAGGWRLSRAGAVMRVTCSSPLAAEPAVWWPDMGVEYPTTRLRARLDPGAPMLSWRLELA